jgi:hypothetical protein
MELFLFNKNGTLESLQITETNKAKFFSDKITVIYNSKSHVINVWVGENVSGTEKKQIPLIQKLIKQRFGLNKDAQQIVVNQRQELHKFLEESDETKGKIRFPEDIWLKKIADSIQAVKEGLAQIKQKIEAEDTKGADVEIKKYLTLATLSGNKDLITLANEIKERYKEKQLKFFEARVEELTENANEILGTGDIPKSIQEFDKIKGIIEEQMKNQESEP